MKCNNCGNDLLPGSTFCTKCGSKIIIEQPITNNFFNQEQVNSQKVDNLLEENREHTFFDGGYNAPVYKKNNSDKSGTVATIVGIIICVLIVAIAAFIAYKVLTKDNDKNNKITCTEKSKYVDSTATIYFKDNKISKISGELSLVNEDEDDIDDASEEDAEQLTYHTFLYVTLMYLDEDQGANIVHKEGEKSNHLTYEIDRAKAKDTSYFDDYDDMTKNDIIEQYKDQGYTCK